MTFHDAHSSTLHIDAASRGPAAFWLTLSGEADIATLAELEEALARVHLQGAQSVHLHLADLQFCDIETIDRLSSFARDARLAGHEVMSCRANRFVHRVAHLLECHQELGLL